MTRAKKAYFKVLSLVLVFVLAVSIFPSFQALATEEITAFDSLSSDMAGGYGSNGKFLAPIDPPVEGSIPISNRAELEAIRNNLSGNYHLTADIDLSGEEWTPLYRRYVDLTASTRYEPFRGIFDGQGHVIKNLTITELTPLYEGIAGLFAYVSNATIKNVGLEGTNINILYSVYFSVGNYYSGGYVGSICSSVSDSSKVFNCYNSGAVFVPNGDFVGGICGDNGCSYISYCYNSGDVNGSYYVGGISGYVTLLPSGISNCYNTGTISSSNISGGVTGVARGGDITIYAKEPGSISNCFNKGLVIVTSDISSAYAGGIYGYNSITNRNAETTNCYNIGTVTAYSKNNNACAGGIVGGNEDSWVNGKINNCYSIGSVSATTINGETYTGGIYGYKVSSSSYYFNITNSYCLDLYGSPHGTQLTSSQMKNAVNFVGFDFENVWDISPDINDGYPFLRAFGFSGEQEGEILEKKGTFTYYGGDALGKTSGNYSSNYYYSDRFFTDSSYIYRQDLSTMSLCLSMSAFNSEGNNLYCKDDENVVALLKDIGFDEENIDTSLGYQTEPTTNSIGTAIALKPLPIDSNTMLLVVAVRGGNYRSEWGGNFFLGYTDVHQGFSDARFKVINAVSSFMTVHEEELSGKNVKLWIVGYSRGSAVANLVGAYFDDYSNKNNGEFRDFTINTHDIYTYGFEVPASSRESNTNASLYKNIFSIVNPNDVVPKFAPLASNTHKWGYRRYGTTILLPTVETMGSKRYSVFENSMLNQFVEFYKSSGKKFTKSDFNINDFIIFNSVIGWQKYPQSIWLDNFITTAANDLFGSPLNYVQKYQSDIMSVMVDFGSKALDKDSVIDRLLSIPVIVYGALHLNDVVSLKGNGTGLLVAHYPEICLAWMNSFLDNSSLCAEWLSSLGGVSYRIVRVNCPVDVEVYDSDNNFIAGFINDEPYLQTENIIYLGLDDNGQKTIYLPPNEEYSIKIIATGDGEMTYSISEFDRNEEGITRIVNYYEIEIEEGDSFTGIIDDLSDGVTANYTLADSQGEINPSEDLTNDDIELYAVSVNTFGNGIVMGEGSRFKGEYAQLTAIPDENNTFIGWFYNDECISVETSYRFCVLSDVTLEARFTINEILKVTIDKNMITKGDDFNIKTEFTDFVNSNLLVVTYDYDSTKFDYQDFIPADGISIVNTIVNENSVSLILAKLNGYGITNIGNALFTATNYDGIYKENISITVTVEYVCKDENDFKTIQKATTALTDTPIEIDFTLIELSNLIDLFDITSDDFEWGKAKFYDFNSNGIIDIYDIAYLASIIK